MLLLKSEMLDLLTDHLCIAEADLATLKFTFASRPLETLLGYDVPGDLAGKPVEATLPELLTPEFLAAPAPATTLVAGVKRDGTTLALSVLLVPRATTAGRVVVGVVTAVPIPANAPAQP